MTTPDHSDTDTVPDQDGQGRAPDQGGAAASHHDRGEDPGATEEDFPTVPDPDPDDAYDAGHVGAIPPEDEGPAVSRDSSKEQPEGPTPEPDPLASAMAERDALTDQLLRARADYDNLNKRRHKEVAAARDRGAAAVVEGLLDVLDNFGFALKAAAESEDIQLAKGVQLVHGQLLSALEQSGLYTVEGVGAVFDPAHHEALMSGVDDSEREHPEVAEVLRIGYRFKDQLLRPASVRVVE